MMVQPDTIAMRKTADNAGAPSASQKAGLTPKTVLSWLPKGVTPAQQDSMVQKYVKPSEIHWSECPDTLHLPGHTPGKNLAHVDMPVYYKESFFSDNSLFHPELSGERMGVAGNPIPYSIANDHLFSSLLLGCLVLTLTAYAHSRHFIFRQVKDFFYNARIGLTEVTETARELRAQFSLAVQTCLLLAMAYFSYSREYITDSFMIENYQVIALYLFVFLSYFVLKTGVYTFINWIFFDGKKNIQWMRFFLFLIVVEGVSLLPLVFLQTYFHLSVKSSAIYAILIVILIKILSFYKIYAIFFRKKVGVLQFFLYFCALEITPFWSLWGVLNMLSSELKVIF